MRSAQPVFGYPMIQFEDDKDFEEHRYQENASWRKFSSSVINR